MSSFLAPLRIEDAGPGRFGRQVFVLLEDFTYELGAEGSGIVIRIKKGFVTDFASVPRFFWRVIPPAGEHGKACVVHDYLYRKPSGFNKALADAIFFDAMHTLGVSWWKRWVMYLAVSWFGKSAFQWEAEGAPAIPMTQAVAQHVADTQDDIARGIV